MIEAVRRLSDVWPLWIAAGVLLVDAHEAGASLDHNAQHVTSEGARGLGEEGPRRGNWILTPIPVSNPTVGTGLQILAMYLHAPRSGDEDAPTPASGLGAMYTDEGSWFAGAFHQDYLADDRFRLLIVVGAGKVHLAYYGEGSGAGFADDPVNYALRSFVTRLDTRYRLPWTEHWYLGPSYFYGSGEVGFGMDVGSAELPDLRGRFQNAGLGLSLGVTKRLTLALRGSLKHVTAGAPFFDLAALEVRGYSRIRFAAEYSLTVMGEARYEVRPRWGFVVFADAGRVGDEFAHLVDEETITSYGCGLRWQPVADKKLNVGLDVAFTDEDSVVFIQIGERF